MSVHITYNYKFTVRTVFRPKTPIPENPDGGESSKANEIEVKADIEKQGNDAIKTLLLSYCVCVY